MIILDEEDQRQIKSASFPADLSPHTRAAGLSSTHLPDYETSQLQAQQVAARKTFWSRRVDSRFWRAVVYASVIYAGLVLVVGIPLGVLVCNITIVFQRLHIPEQLNIS